MGEASVKTIAGVHIEGAGMLLIGVGTDELALATAAAAARLPSHLSIADRSCCCHAVAEKLERPTTTVLFLSHNK